MRKLIIAAPLLALLPVASFAHSGPFVGETCGVGSDCSYHVSGNSHRIISMDKLAANSTYTCATISSDAPDKLHIDDIVPSSPDMSVTLDPQADLASNPFMTIKTGKTNNVSVTYSLRNIDGFLMDHDVVYQCRKAS